MSPSNYTVEKHKQQWLVLDSQDRVVASGLLTREAARKIAKRFQARENPTRYFCSHGLEFCELHRRDCSL